MKKAKKILPRQGSIPIKTRTFKLEPLPESQWVACPSCRGTGFIKNIGDNGSVKGQMACPVATCTEGTIDSKMVYSDIIQPKLVDMPQD